MQAMSQFSCEVHPHDETLPNNEQVFRVEIFLKAGAALGKVGIFRPLLEKYEMRLADCEREHVRRHHG